jgi:drug/metabolite transporter (DMT)-like permease
VSQRWLIVAALFAVYVIWGSTYAAMAIGVDHFPPFMLGGLRYSAAGALILFVLLLRGEAFPRWPVWRTGAITGLFLLVVGNGAVNVAVTTVSSGLAALVVASSSLFAAMLGNGLESV